MIVTIGLTADTQIQEIRLISAAMGKEMSSQKGMQVIAMGIPLVIVGTAS